jgi:hypothetical protein
MQTDRWPARAFSVVGARVFGLLGLLVLVGLCVLRSSIGTRLDTFTVDEPWHIVAGTAYLRSGDFSLNPEHPPLVKLWAGASMPRDFALRKATVLSEKTQERTWVEQTMFMDNDPARAQAFARAGMWALHGTLLFVCSGCCCGVRAVGSGRPPRWPSWRSNRRSARTCRW